MAIHFIKDNSLISEAIPTDQDPLPLLHISHTFTLPQEVDELKRQVNTEQRGANDWREKWNFQNFKLNLMVDMLVLRVLEQVGVVEVRTLCEKHGFELALLA